MTSRWVPWLATALVWLVAAAGAAAWALPLLTSPIPLPPQAVVVGSDVLLAGPAGLEKLFGRPIAPPTVEQAQAPAQSRFKLLGVVAPRAPAGAGSGLALLSIDGKLPRAFALGAEVEPGLRVLKIGLRRVELGVAGSAAMVLELPPLAAATASIGADLVVPGSGPGLPGRLGINPVTQPMPNQARPGPIVGVGIPGAGIGPTMPITTDRATQ